MKFKSTIFAQTSGSLAGKTFSHNKGGMYVRARATPINPNTTAQQAVRASLKTLTTRWSNFLAQPDRDSWTLYATNVPLLNKLGEPHQIPPLAMYLRCNSPRLTTGTSADIIDVGPSTFSLATLPVPSFTATPNTLSLTFDNTADWATHTGGFMFVYMSRPQNPSINFFKGPFQLAARIAGDTTTPPTSPASISTVPFDFVVGQKIFVRVNCSNADGRLSSSFIVSTIAA